ncbi:MAG: magnesium-translocating P-type ATPase [Blastocatellales bacterium]
MNAQEVKSWPYWSEPAEQVLRALSSGPNGLSRDEASIRLAKFGPNDLDIRPGNKLLGLFLDRFRNPLLIILIFAAAVSLIVRDWIDAVIVAGIVFLSAVLSTLQEYRASNAVAELRSRISTKSRVMRDGEPAVVESSAIVPGDVILLSAGSLIPADCLILDARDLYVSQALLTGETFPVEKRPGTVSQDAALVDRQNSLFMGTSVRSGTARAVAVLTARDTVFGKVSLRLGQRPPETEFERGLRHFGGLLMRIMIVVVLSVLTVNVILQRPAIDTMLFAVALAVGLSPELLPGILAITLARGARKMARQGVIVRHLNAIENLGSMDVLCTDKTGTITRGVIVLDAALDSRGGPDDQILRYAGINSLLQTGMVNPLDDAVAARLKSRPDLLQGVRKIDEIPYDFNRKRLTIVIREDDGLTEMITKGALENVLEVCDRVQRGDAILPLDEAVLAEIRDKFAAWSGQGFRVLGLAVKTVEESRGYHRLDEQGMVFRGFLLFFDPPEPGISDTLARLTELGVRLKIITGDNHLVARHVAGAVGLNAERILTGREIADLKDEALWHLAPQITVFAEVDPNQKERIIVALQKSGHVVGYLGDGINDAPALQAADVGISVDQAVDVARQAADFILLEHNLDIVRVGIDEGRHTFANTLKYIFITTSANFGNMISMALASMFLPFLPLLAKQILLNNFLSDIPAMGIAGDNVEREWEFTPHRWNIRHIRNFMLVFGLVSSFFDVVTFAGLFYLIGERQELFRTGWFIESLLTELLIIFVIRTYKPFYRSRPGRFLASSSVIVAILAVLIPWLPYADVFGLVPLPAPVMAFILATAALYVMTSEAVKRMFFSIQPVT